MLRLTSHFRRHKTLCIQVGITAVVMFLSPTVALASSVDDGGMKIYWKIVNVGKYVILVKGAVNSIQSVLDGDYEKAKHQFIGYLICFGAMLALPGALNQIEELFKS
ncbi:hypothetical protein [Desulfosporosinus youngiae]|uniref:Uncharacterized protein n=1 Tax=Desulfosporosinus youngiae DSM 17734 TaxID=768710 RepID=H5XZR2_9FIRM|nr:hypothetical protein [Desulfosporosinus youngiae]EHQ92108.1 hypothetical protein DesyoDRAFT_5177 [Desulfosporosinus youngiae DSM 17734]